ncbi:hypothetical protein [Helicobacter gastrocanis]|nr:hypothetical protein [Helicobacter sp. NHP19-003]
MAKKYGLSAQAVGVATKEPLFKVLYRQQERAHLPLPLKPPNTP